MGRAGITVEQFLHSLQQHLPGRATVKPALPADAGSAPVQAEQPAAEPLPPRDPEPAEIEELILKGMRDLEPNVDRGAPVLVRDLRRDMPAEYQLHETFDRAVIRLAETGRIVLHRHDHPSLLSADELAELVKDEAGTYYTLIAHRV